MIEYHKTRKLSQKFQGSKYTKKTPQYLLEPNVALKSVSLCALPQIQSRGQTSHPIKCAEKVDSLLPQEVRADSWPPQICRLHISKRQIDTMF
ncbi:hypothetical protein HUJ04_000700 [Dendroctonus ponderosae]|nr:hypothetical protein HUJ04_000700 [Dendroctonus ponderosae]